MSSGKAFGSFFIQNFEAILSFLGIFISSCILWMTAKAINEQNRPYISFSIETYDDPDQMFIVIRNTGNRTAKNITIYTNPKLKSYFTKESEMPSLINDDGAINLSGLAPGQIIKSFFDYASCRPSKYKNNFKSSVVTIKYSSNCKKFEGLFNIDFAYLDKRIVVTDSTDLKKNIKRIADKIESIEKNNKLKL